MGGTASGVPEAHDPRGGEKERGAGDTQGGGRDEYADWLRADGEKETTPEEPNPLYKARLAAFGETTRKAGSEA